MKKNYQKRSLEYSTREELLKYITPELIEHAIQKKMVLFLALVAAISIPEGKYATFETIRKMIEDIRVQNMLHMTALSNAASNGYLERKSIRREGINEKEIYGHVKKTTQGVLRISRRGEKRLKDYLSDILFTNKVKPQFPSLATEKNILISFLKTIEDASRTARLKLETS